MLSPIDVFAVLLIDRDGESDPTFDVAQFDKTVLPIIQVNAVVLGDAIRFIQAVLDIEELSYGERWSDEGSVGLIDLVGQCRSGRGVIGGLRQAFPLGQYENDTNRRNYSVSSNKSAQVQHAVVVK